MRALERRRGLRRRPQEAAARSRQEGATRREEGESLRSRRGGPTRARRPGRCARNAWGRNVHQQRRARANGAWLFPRPDEPPAGQHVFLELPDRLGSTTSIIDQQTSELVERTTYTAFGFVESDYEPARWGSFREAFKFTGKEDDIALGITYFGARFFSPYLGTWMSPDPLTIHGLGSDTNPYAYVGGRVSRGFDLGGLCDGSIGAEMCAPDGSGYGYNYGYSDDGDDVPPFAGPYSSAYSASGQIIRPPAPPPAPRTPTPVFNVATAPATGWSSAGSLWSREGQYAFANNPIDPATIAAFNRGIDRNSTVIVAAGSIAVVQVGVIGFFTGQDAVAGYVAVDNSVGAMTNATVRGVTSGLGTGGRAMAAGLGGFLGASHAYGPDDLASEGGEAVAEEAFDMTKTVADHAEDVVTRGPFSGELARPYVNSPLTVQEIMQAAKGVPDPQGVPGALRWDVPGSFRGSDGTWELVVDTTTNTILHFNFTGPR